MAVLTHCVQNRDIWQEQIAGTFITNHVADSENCTLINKVSWNLKLIFCTPLDHFAMNVEVPMK